jgi:catechol 2,3-dioxygenase-like lactoylglutathione lyase family enzyme
MLTSVDHAQITIPKGAEDNAKAFYCEFLGLKEIEKPDNRKNNGGFWLEVGGFQVHVGTEDGFDSLPFPKARAFEFRDPFGNRAELIEIL